MHLLKLYASVSLFSWCSWRLFAAADTTEWPGSPEVTVADGRFEFGENLSGLDYNYDSSGNTVMWAIQNNPSRVYRLLRGRNDVWDFDTSDRWRNGKSLTYPDGKGNPDTEDLVIPDHTADVMYACAERNDANDESHTSRLSVLRYALDEAAPHDDNTLIATHEWQVTSSLPAVDPNTGLEGISFVPDEFLVQGGLVDGSTGQFYSPGSYGNHGGGLFFLGLEADGNIYAMALDHDDSSQHRLVANFTSGEAQTMAVYFDKETGYLWTHCDDTCDNKHSVLQLDGGAGTFVVRDTFARPEGLGNFNNEGFVVFPEETCGADGTKPVYWADDGNDDNHAIRRGSVSCGSFIA